MTREYLPVGRRGFLKASLAASVVAPIITEAASASATEVVQQTIATPIARSPWLLNAESKPLETTPASQHIQNPGSDYMVDVLRSLGVEYVALCPGSTFRGLQESLASYGDTDRPATILCVHEEISAAICHGYAKVAGKPMACLVHSNVGLQHASMALYNAWCDRVPMLVIAGNVLDATKRRAGVEWLHSAQDLAAMVRDFVKWDDQPISLQHYGESVVRAYALSMTPPMGPVLIAADSELQENPVEDANLKIPRLTIPTPPVGDPATVGRVADMLLAAHHPVIVADRAARTAEGMALLVTLAEKLNAPVIDLLSRLNFPTNHALNHSFLQPRLIANADLIVGLELTDPWGLVNTVDDIVGRPARRLIQPDCKVVSISAEYLSIKANQQDFERYLGADICIAADAQATLPILLTAIEQRLTPERQASIAARRPALEAAFHKMRDDARYEAARGWDASPVSTARLAQELWDKIKNEKWAVVSPTGFFGRWPQRLWDFTEYHQFIGAEGGYGVGYGAPAAVGAALAHKQAGRMSINIQTDGDLMMLPGVLWTMAHHELPLLTVMHNNRTWHQESMHLQRMASRRDRHAERARLGTAIIDPAIDYAMLARSMGVWAEGPIEDPTKLSAVLARALAVVKSGKPALVDVVTQPR